MFLGELGVMLSAFPWGLGVAMVFETCHRNVDLDDFSRKIQGPILRAGVDASVPEGIFETSQRQVIWLPTLTARLQG